MRLAARTWALVVGIDQYDDPALTVLESPVPDAVRAVRWLRDLGVPPNQILLHAVPGGSENSGALNELVRDLLAADPLWQTRGRADVPNLWRSLVTLSRQSGDRLFLFLFGHGFYELGSGRLFLTQEASGDLGWRNLGLDVYAQHLLSFAFPRQFMIVNACQNHPLPVESRPQVVAEFHDPTRRGIPQVGNSLLACYAASQGQYVREVGGRGLFTSALFDAINLQQPHPEGMKYDAISGMRSLHLRPLMENHLIDVVIEEAQKAQVSDQKPAFSATLIDHMDEPALCELPTDTLQLEVNVDSAADAALLRIVRIEQFEPFPWLCEHPARGRPLSFPAQHRVPTGGHVMVHWALRTAPQGRPSVGVDEFTVNHDLKHVIRLRPFLGREYPFLNEVRGSKAFLKLFFTDDWRSSTHFELRAVNSQGLPVQGWEQRNEQIANKLGMGELTEAQVRDDLGFVVLLSEYGLNVFTSAQAHSDALKFVHLVKDAAREAFADGDLGEITLVVREIPLEVEPDKRSGIRVLLPQNGASGLSGFLTQRPSITVTPLHADEDSGIDPINAVSFSLDRLTSNDLFDVPIGLHRLQLALPWGGWSTVVRVRAGEQVTVSLPEMIGSPPLRVGLYVERTRFSRLGDLLLGVDGTMPTLSATRDGDEPVEVIKMPKGTAVWAAKLHGTAGPPSRGRLVELEFAEGRVMFPLAGRALAVQLASGVRIEPLSDSPLEAWDRLVGKGLLDELTEEDMTALLNHKWSDPLLGLAGGYALYARGDRPRLQRVADNLHSVIPGVDVDLLRAAATQERPDFEQNDFTRRLLLSHAREQSIPLFRWGVPLALNLSAVLADSPEVREWRTQLLEVVRGLSVRSVWTVWTPT